MDEQIISKVLGYIEDLGKTVSNGATYGFELLVKQQMLEGIVWTSISILFLLASIIIAPKIIMKIYKASDEFFASMTGFVVVIISLIAVVSLPSHIMSIFNPEYYAIKEIMDMFNSNN